MRAGCFFGSATVCWDPRDVRVDCIALWALQDLLEVTAFRDPDFPRSLLALQAEGKLHTIADEKKHRVIEKSGFVW